MGVYQGTPCSLVYFLLFPPLPILPFLSQTPVHYGCDSGRNVPVYYGPASHFLFILLTITLPSTLLASDPLPCRIHDRLSFVDATFDSRASTLQSMIECQLRNRFAVGPLSKALHSGIGLSEALHSDMMLSEGVALLG